MIRVEVTIEGQETTSRLTIGDESWHVRFKAQAPITLAEAPYAIAVAMTSVYAHIAKMQPGDVLAAGAPQPTEEIAR